MTDLPHIAWPVRIINGQFATVEQDSPEDIAGCAQAALLTPYGHRASQPDFGLPEQTFRENGVEPQDLLDTLRRDEPRAAPIVQAARVEGVAQTVRVILNELEA